MLRSRFLWKLYAIFAFLIFLTIGLVATLTGRLFEREALAQLESRLLSEALLVREIAHREIDDGELERLQQRVRNLGSEVGTRFTVIAADGRVLADSDYEPERMDDHGQRPEILALRTAAVGTATRFSKTSGARRMYLALPIDPARPELGFVRTSLRLDTVVSRRGELRRIVGLGTVLASLVALALSFFFARRVTRPLVALTAAADAMAEGQGELAIDVGTGDEIGTLGRALNTMSRRLRRQLATITSDRNQLTAILSSMAEGVVAIDRNERIVHMNRVAGDLLELDPEGVSGRAIWEVTRIREISEALTEAMEQASPVERSICLPGPNDRILELYGTPLRDGGGALAGAVLVLDDVTKLHRLETMRKDFVANVSHELKTPVTAIRGYVETLLDDPELPPETRHRFLAKVYRQSERLSSLVTDLLSLSRLEAESGSIALEPVDAREAVIESVRALQAEAEKHGLELTSELPSEPAAVLGNEEVLRQAMTNLLDNAIKYSPRGGKVWARVTATEERVTLEVEDDGPGIDLRHQARIFERFYRIDKARSRELGGTGLGLAIVKHVARVLGGTVTLESRPGHGSIFRILLPKAPIDVTIGRRTGSSEGIS